MKKVVQIMILCLPVLGMAQEETKDALAGNNEFKFNAGYTVAGIPEISYERILSDDSSVGLSVAAVIDEDIDYNFLIIPYYRFYFGKKRNSGFFLEANGAAFTEDRDDRADTELGMGLGLGIGGKFLTKNGWVGELIGGAGRNFLNADVISEVYPRLGISIGKRF
ncbi:MAG: DUF3575 domain-containing protein [Bacteroidota bacterium]